MNQDQVSDKLRIVDLKRILNDDSVIIDVGAHKGEFSAQLRTFTSAKIYAFEPIEQAFEALSNLIKDNNFFPVNKAVGKSDGKAIFHVMESFLGSSLLPAVPDQSSTWLHETHQISVPTIRLDTFIESQSLKNISLLKTDTEGTDFTVLESAGKYLEPNFINALLVEISFHEFHRGQDSYWKVMELASSKNYFLAGFYPHFNHKNWLWWADILFLPNNKKYSTNL